MVSILCNIESLDTKNIPTSRMNSNSSVNYGMEYQTTFDFFDFYRTLVSILSCGLKAILYCFIHPHKYSSSSIFYLCTLILLKGVMSEDLDPILYPPPILLGPQSVFQCNEENQCQSAKMTCTEKEHCYVNCTATFACQFASIKAPKTGDLTVYCSGTRACDITTITSTGAEYGNLNVECASGGAVCENVNIYCPFNGICDVRFGVLGKYIFVDASPMNKGSLLVHGTGQYGTIKCPGNNNECIIECNAYGCRDSIFQTQVDTELQITASGAESLKNSKVFCPSGDGECLINTYGDGPELLSHFELYSINGFEDISFSCNYSTEMSPNCFNVSNPPKLYCTSDYSKKCNIELESGIENWQCSEIDTAVLCNENIANGYYGNTLICNQVEECQSKTLYCNDNEDCNVYCEGDYACHLATIHAPTTGNLIVYCSGTRACDTAIIYGATNGDLQVKCASGDAVCESLDIYCPDNGLCELDCGVLDILNRCKAIFVDARSMYTGSLLIHGTGQCAEVQCPGNNNECIIECAANGCKDSTIKAQAITSKLNITAFGINSLRNSYIYCPCGTVNQSPGECLIHTYGAGPDILSGTNIYAINGLADLSLLCDYSTDTANCYDIETPPHLCCTPEYDATCDIILDPESGFNQWQCFNTLSSARDVCQWTYEGMYPNIPVTINPTCIPTSAPTKYLTNAPTKNPTFFTNTPTNYPTMPTVSPTVSTSAPSAPTKNPTGNPITIQTTKYPTSVTSAPTKNPTNAPSEPTSQPSIAPTTTQTTDPTAYPTQPPTFCYNAKYSRCMFEALNDDLWSDEVLTSINCKYILKMNKNGNLILYGKYNEYDFVAKWMTNTTIFGRTGVSIPHFVIENGQLRIVEYPHKNKPGVNSIELWKSNNKSSHAVQTNNVLTTKKVTNVLTLTNYGCLIFAEGKNSKNFIWRLCVDGATTPSSTNVVNMDESEQSADFSQNMNSDWADLWWVWLLIVFVIAISLLICFGLYEYKKHQNEKWITSPACASVSAVSSPHSPSCASNFEVNDNQHMHCDSGFKETDKQIKQWAQETCYNGGRNVDIDGVEIMYSNDGTEDGPADQMQTKK